MRMYKQGKGGGNAVDEEEKRQASARNGRHSAPLTRLTLGECAPIRQTRTPQQRCSARYTTISAITGNVIRENTVVRKVPRDIVRVSPS